MILDKISAMLMAAEGKRRLFPATVLFNENWLLRVVLDWFSAHELPRHPMTFFSGARWFSEAMLPSAFLARYRGDPLAESWTHADGVIGHFEIGTRGRGDLTLQAGATQLIVIEGKMFSPLSRGVKNAPLFDQAARNVACVAEVLRRADRAPDTIAALGFYVVAPECRIDEGAFARQIARASIRGKVEGRAQAYQGDCDRWLDEWFAPTLQRIRIGCLSWESIIASIGESDASTGKAIDGFYRKCVLFNQLPRERLLE